MAEATRYQRLISGLLGEDIAGMSEEERKRLSREGTTAAIVGMLRGTGLLGGLEGYGQRRLQERAQRRVSEAEAEMPRITGRLFGGTAGALESLPGGEGGPLTARYRQAPQEALARLYGTQAGRDVATMAPDLAKLATEGTLGRTVGGSVYNPVTGQFTRPPEAAKPRVPARTVDLGNQVVVYYDDGSTEVLPKGGAPRAGGAAAPRVGSAPGVTPGVTPGAGNVPPFRFQTLTPEEVVAAGFPEGTVVQRDTQTGALKPLSSVPAAQRTGEAGKETALSRIDAVTSRILSHMDKVKTGGVLGATGALSRVFDSQDARLFESYRQQLSSALRTALRIPGEGALSDREQAQYGLQLPELGQSRENNEAILASLREQVGLAAGKAVAPAAPPAAPAAPQLIYRNGRLVPAQSR